MKLSIPKPIHGWVGLTGEVEIIIIGVMIELRAERLCAPAIA